ncbi:MAG: DNA repair protein RecO, partial [Eudoraea sp.]|nr:DNA repair protein RecO [Eudoraea sp.]
VKGVLKSRRGKLKPAYFQPLTLLELVVSHREKADMHYIREAKISIPYTSLPTHWTKQAIVLFLSEVLTKSIREEEKNEPLFDYLQTSLQWLDTHEEVVNFHLVFLMQLTKYLGFFPDTSGIKEPYFELVEGVFVKEPGMHPLIQGEDLVHFKTLLGTHFEALKNVQLSKQERRDLLGHVLSYFEVHLQGFNQPKSLAVLHEVFS